MLETGQLFPEAKDMDDLRQKLTVAVNAEAKMVDDSRVEAALSQGLVTITKGSIPQHLIQTVRHWPHLTLTHDSGHRSCPLPVTDSFTICPSPSLLSLLQLVLNIDTCATVLRLASRSTSRRSWSCRARARSLLR